MSEHPAPLGDFRVRAWRALGGDEAALAALPAPAPALLPAQVPCGALLADSVGLAALAIQHVQLARGMRDALAPVALDAARITTSAQCERHLRIDGTAPEVWAPLSGFWRAADGWVRTHGNYPHHARRLATLLGIEPDAAKSEVEAAMARHEAVELETRAAEVGAIVGAVRTPEAWAALPEGRAVAEEPAVRVRTDARTGSRAAWRDAGAPLSGIRVLDLTRVLAGPIAARDLAFAGAEVLRVDSPRLPELGWQHLETGHGKRSTTLDLDDPNDRRRFEELLAEADVVITGYRPGALDRHGLSAQALWERRPGLVIGAVGAWSESGPWAARRGFDSIVQAVTGIAMRQSPDGEIPGALPAQALDHSAGHLLAAGLCLALARRAGEDTGSAVRVGLAGLAQELLVAPAGQTESSGRALPATVQTSPTAAGEITTALPPFTYPDGPDAYPRLASPWGTDAAAWR